MYYLKMSNPISGSVCNFCIESIFDLSIASMVFVGQLPRLSKITFGGKPLVKYKFRKSSSFVTTVKLWSFAYCQIFGSSASLSETIRT